MCVTQDIVRLCQVRVIPYKREIVRLECVRIAGLKDMEAAKALRQAWEGWRIKPESVSAVISAQDTITKNIEIPSNNPQEIREIINLQAGRHTPYSRDEIVADYLNIGAFKNNYSKILLVILARTLLKQRMDILERAGIRVSRVLFAPEAVAVTATRLCKIDQNAQAPSLIVDVHDHHADCVIVRNNRTLFVRTIPLGSSEFAQEKDARYQKFCDELKKSLEAYQNEDIDKRPASIHVTGVSDDNQELAAALEDSLAMNSRLVAYARALSLSPEAQKQLSASPRVSYLETAAAVFAADDCSVDFTPDEIRMRRLVEQRGRELMKTGVLVLVLFVLVSGLVISRFMFKSSYLHQLSRRQAELSAQVKELDADVKKVAFIKSYLRRRGLALDVLTELYEVSPQELQLSDIRFEADKFTVRGSADSMSTVFSFAENLERSKLFREVKTKNTMKRRENDKDVTDFEIGALIEEQSR